MPHRSGLSLFWIKIYQQNLLPPLLIVVEESTFSQKLLLCINDYAWTKNCAKVFSCNEKQKVIKINANSSKNSDLHCTTLYSIVLYNTDLQKVIKNAKYSKKKCALHYTSYIADLHNKYKLLKKNRLV